MYCLTDINSQCRDDQFACSSYPTVTSPQSLSRGQLLSTEVSLEGGGSTLHRSAFYQFPFQWIYYYDSNKSIGKETDKMHLCNVLKTNGLM